MGFKLTKSEEAKRDYLRDKLIEEREVLMSIVDEQEGAIQQAYAAINDAFENYNEVLVRAQDFVTDIMTEREDEYDDRSERWQDGDRGTEARDWLDALQATMDDLDPLEPVTYEETNIDPENHADVLDNMPTEAG